MSTQERIDSSRANGAKPHGPVTPEGRARSSAARLTNGLSSGVVVLSYESDEEYNALRDEYFADYQPQTRSRSDLVDHLVATRWRLNRVIALQTALLDLQIDRQKPEMDREFQGCGPDIRAAIAYQRLCDDSRGLESLHRHETRLNAELRRALKLLDAQPKNQIFHHEPSPAQPPHSDEDADARGTQPSPTGHPPSTAAEAPPSTSSDRPPSATEEDAARNLRPQSVVNYSGSERYIKC